MKRQRPRFSVVVTCPAKKHRVQLDTRRLWATARCPKCKSRVDPTRVRRVLGVVAGLYRMSGATRAERVTVWGTWGYLAGMLLAWIGLWGLGDVWGPMTVLLFGPRWVLLLPLIALVPAVIALRRRMLLPLILALLVAVGPVMGFRIGWRRWIGADRSDATIRVATFNAAGGLTLNTSLPWILDEIRADVLAIQECGGRLADAVRALADVAWHTHVQSNTCLVSRFRVDSVAQMDRDHFEFAGGAGVVVRHKVEVADQAISITNVHLDTPREGLVPLRDGSVAEGLRTLRSKSLVRDIESRQARLWVDAVEGPFLVLGDFNLPVESVVYRRHWGDLTNAFSYVGFGFGSTRFAGCIRVRIDHILVSEGWKVVRAFVGPDFGSDHRPIVADFVPPAPRP